MRCDICLQKIDKPVKPYWVKQGNLSPNKIKSVTYRGKKLHLCNTCFRIITFVTLSDSTDYDIIWEADSRHPRNS